MCIATVSALAGEYVHLAISDEDLAISDEDLAISDEDLAKLLGMVWLIVE